MSTRFRICFAAALTISLLSACTDRDHDLAKKTGDGSDTFKYVPPDSKQPPQKPAANHHRANDGSDSFHYKPDTRGFPTPSPAPAPATTSRK